MVTRRLLCPRRGAAACGFTIIELLVVLAVIAMLLAIAAPRYVHHLDEARDAALRQDLRQLRESIDQFKADKSRAPVSLAELVSEHYLREIPVDPVTQRVDSWRVKAVEESAPGILDVHSGAPGTAMDGTAYASW